MPTGLPAANTVVSSDDEGWVWAQIKAEARRDAESEPALASYLYSTILSHSSLERSLSFHLGNKLCSSTLLSTLLYDLFLNAFSSDPSLSSAAVADLRAARERDPACVSYSHCLLNYKRLPRLARRTVWHTCCGGNRGGRWHWHCTLGLLMCLRWIFTRRRGLGRGFCLIMPLGWWWGRQR
ncbi:serine acetyltransferase 5-like [Vigna umbellata]|uniref:serine acetyltransferase 5-like n=1 Tax=Vigna umbellata TaxID=87088 RepID=UPI001F5F0B24|nr:serine acetyltransferase 5-like [Vigna umbellata]XP_047171663.1 serine acetyltransferase 5-like [Vigna umbellata]